MGKQSQNSLEQCITVNQQQTNINFSVVMQCNRIIQLNYPTLVIIKYCLS